MERSESEFKRVVRSTETAKSVSELLKRWYAKAKEAGAQGRPVAWCMASTPPELLNYFEVEANWPENYGTVCASRDMAVPFIERAEGEGFSPDICSYMRIALGYTMRWLEVGATPPEAPIGGMARPNFLLTNSVTCDPRTKGFQALARYFDIPLHICDWMTAPYGVDVSDERVKRHYVAHNLEELKGMVAFLEEQTGKRFNEADFAGIVANSLETQKLLWEIHQLRRAIPGPMPSEDFFACIIPQMYMLGSEEALAFFRRLYQEVKHRVDNGIGVIPQERYRVLWMGIPPWYNLGLFNYLESLGAVSVKETVYQVWPPAEVDTPSPLEAMVLMQWHRNKMIHRHEAEVMPECSYATAQYSAGQVVECVREYDGDGVIMHSTRSCRAVSFGQAHTRRMLKEAGVLAVALESDMADPRTWSDAHVKMRISAFIEALAAAKAGARAGA